MSNDFDMLFAKWDHQLEGLSREYRGVILACSGGIDSTVLLNIFCQYFKSKNNFEFAVCHVNFGLRGEESDLDERFLRDLCDHNKLTFYPHQASGQPPEIRQGQSTQEWARNVRYKFFQEFTEKGWLIALAHQQDDMAENIILRLCRGTSTGSLAGMSEWRLPYWRPLLSVSRNTIESWAIRHKLPHREDRTNATMDYSRNVIRHKILPELNKLFPGATDRISRVGKEASETVQFVRDRLNTLITRQSTDTVSASIPALRELSPAVIKEALIHMTDLCDGSSQPHFEALQNRHGRFSSKKLDRIVDQILNSQRDNPWSTEIRRGGLLKIDKEIVSMTGSRTPSADQERTQHQKSLTPVDMNFLLGAGASRTCFRPMARQNQVLTFKNQRDTPIHIRTYVPKKNTKLLFPGNKKAVSVDDLFKRLKLKPDERTRCFIIELDGNILCLAGEINYTSVVSKKLELGKNYPLESEEFFFELSLD